MNREQLLERQYQLLSCLVAAGPDPEGMPAPRLRIVSRGLACKRRREALSSWPGLSGTGLDSWFDEYAANHQRPAGGSPLLDGYQFCLWLAERGNRPAIAIVSECLPYRQSVRPRRAWEGHFLRARYAVVAWWRRQYPEYTPSHSLPALS